MGTENSSKETRERAKNLAKDIGAYHVDLNMDTVVKVKICGTFSGCPLLLADANIGSHRPLYLCDELCTSVQGPRRYHS